jgi:hypothetical protein
MHLIIPLFLILAVTGSLRAQVSIRIADPASCRNCALDLALTARLGGPADPTGNLMLADVSVDSRGRYAVASPFAIGEIAIYDATGRFLRTVGRRGGGPGEFEHGMRLRFGSGDSLHAIQENGRYSVFDPSLAYVRSVTLPSRVFEFDLARSGEIVASSPAASDGAPLAVQVFSPSGGRLRAFDEIEGNSGGAARRYVAVAPDGGYWTLQLERYEIRSYDRQGILQRSYRGRREWISEEPLPQQLNPMTTQPPGQMAGLAVDGAGRVWVFAIVADANWRPMQPQGGPPDPAAIFDTVVEVFDSRTGTLIAHGRLNEVARPLGAGRAHGTVAQPDGDGRVTIWNLALPRNR